MLILLHIVLGIVIVALIADCVQGRKVRARLEQLEKHMYGFKLSRGSSDSWHDGLVVRTGLLESARSTLADTIAMIDGGCNVAFETADKANQMLADEIRQLKNEISRINYRNSVAIEKLEAEFRDRVRHCNEIFGPTWKTQDGFTVVPALMSDSHLRNAMKWIEERQNRYGLPKHNAHYIAFQRELDRRDNDDAWHQKMRGGPSPRQLLAKLVANEKQRIDTKFISFDFGFNTPGKFAQVGIEKDNKPSKPKVKRKGKR